MHPGSGLPRQRTGAAFQTDSYRCASDRYIDPCQPRFRSVQCPQTNHAASSETLRDASAFGDEGGRMASTRGEGQSANELEAIAHVTLDERQLVKALHWYDGFVVCLGNPGFLMGSLGFTIGSIGGLGALMIWGLSMAIAVLQNKVWTEPATMFPDRSGGLPIYAYEGWKRYFTPFGAMAAVGYWFAWSTVLAIFGL